MTVNTNSGPQPQSATQPPIDVWLEFTRPLRTARAQVGTAVVGLLTSATMHVIALATGHYSVSTAAASSLALIAPVMVLGRYLVTGRLDALPRQPQSDQLG